MLIITEYKAINQLKQIAGMTRMGSQQNLQQQHGNLRQNVRKKKKLKTEMMLDTNTLLLTLIT